MPRISPLFWPLSDRECDEALVVGSIKGTRVNAPDPSMPGSKTAATSGRKSLVLIVVGLVALALIAVTAIAVFSRQLGERTGGPSVEASTSDVATEAVTSGPAAEPAGRAAPTRLEEVFRSQGVPAGFSSDGETLVILNRDLKVITGVSSESGAEIWRTQLLTQSEPYCTVINDVVWCGSSFGGSYAPYAVSDGLQAAVQVYPSAGPLLINGEYLSYLDSALNEQWRVSAGAGETWQRAFERPNSVLAWSGEGVIVAFDKQTGRELHRSQQPSSDLEAYTVLEDGYIVAEAIANPDGPSDYQYTGYLDDGTELWRTTSPLKAEFMSMRWFNDGDSVKTIPTVTEAEALLEDASHVIAEHCPEYGYVEVVAAGSGMAANGRCAWVGNAPGELVFPEQDGTHFVAVALPEQGDWMAGVVQELDTARLTLMVWDAVSGRMTLENPQVIPSLGVAAFQISGDLLTIGEVHTTIVYRLR